MKYKNVQFIFFQFTFLLFFACLFLHAIYKYLAANCDDTCWSIIDHCSIAKEFISCLTQSNVTKEWKLILWNPIFFSFKEKCLLCYKTIFFRHISLFKNDFYIIDFMELAPLFQLTVLFNMLSMFFNYF